MNYEEKLKAYSSRVSDTRVTLDIEGWTLPEKALDTGWFHWLTLVNTHGDDGKRYFIELQSMTGIKEAGVDIWMMEVGSETGTVVPLSGTIYMIANYQMNQAVRNTLPVGRLSIKRSDHEVAIDLGDAHIRCRDDNTWHYNFEDRQRNIRLEMVHHGAGSPMWYGKEKPLYLTPHAPAYGYNWSGRVEGELVIQGRKVRLKGAGLRERFLAIDQCAAEIGGWEDWMWFHFDEMFGSMCEFKFSKVKEMSLNIVEGKQFFPVGNFNIEHSIWAYHPQLGVFVPTHYKMALETEAGVLEMSGNIVESKLWGTRGELPDSPVYTHNFDKLDGIFTYKDGRKVTLKNGLGGGCVRLWKPYPGIIMPQTEQLKAYTNRVLLFE